MNAEQYLERIENKRLNNTPLYNKEEMIDFAEKYAKQLNLHSVVSSFTAKEKTAYFIGFNKGINAKLVDVLNKK
jgi:hypothetical protein